MAGLPDWSRAYGAPAASLSIRGEPDQFQVEERLGFEFSGSGEHDYLYIEKSGTNTAWLAKQLATYAGIPIRDVGYAGLKDRHALTRQWFSIRQKSATSPDWQNFAAEGVRLLDVRRHRRKLKRGAHKGNRFRIAIRNRADQWDKKDVDARLNKITACGVPNYFGPQRFGRQGRNVDRCRRLLAGAKAPRLERSLALSAGRSLLFNAILDARVRAATWDVIQPGECVSLDGSRSVFAADCVTPELEARCNTFDIHPSATLWGRGAPLSRGAVAELEQAIAGKEPELSAGLCTAGLKAASRPLRLRVDDVSAQIDEDLLWLEFSLVPGGYATAVLREFGAVEDADGSSR